VLDGYAEGFGRKFYRALSKEAVLVCLDPLLVGCGAGQLAFENKADVGIRF